MFEILGRAFCIFPTTLGRVDQSCSQVPNVKSQVKSQVQMPKSQVKSQIPKLKSQVKSQVQVGKSGQVSRTILKVLNEKLLQTEYQKIVFY